jgi:hypothetical protein
LKDESRIYIENLRNENKQDMDNIKNEYKIEVENLSSTIDNLNYKLDDLYDNNNELLERICFELLNNNIYCLRIRNNIFIAPPLIIDNEILIDTIDKIDMIFERILNIGTYNEYDK